MRVHYHCQMAILAQDSACQAVDHTGNETLASLQMPHKAAKAVQVIWCKLSSGHEGHCSSVTVCQHTTLAKAYCPQKEADWEAVVGGSVADLQIQNPC